MPTQSKVKQFKCDSLTFNIMVIGPSGCGKATFLNHFLSTYSENSLNFQCNSTAECLLSIKASKLGSVRMLDSGHNTIDIAIYETPGYGDKINNNDSIDMIKQNLISRHKIWNALIPQNMTEQEVLDADERVHCLFYFITPHRMKEIDYEFIKEISPYVPIVPIVSKADMMTVNERNRFLNEIKFRIDQISIEKGGIFSPIHDFHGLDINNEYLDTQYGFQHIPNIFSIICGTCIMEPRIHNWNRSLPANSDQFSDMTRLKSLFFENGYAIKSLLDSTRVKSMHLNPHSDPNKPLSLLQSPHHVRTYMASSDQQPRQRSNTMQMGKLQIQTIPMHKRAKDNSHSPTPGRSETQITADNIDDTATTGTTISAASTSVTHNNNNLLIQYSFINNPAVEHLSNANSTTHPPVSRATIDVPPPTQSLPISSAATSVHHLSPVSSSNILFHTVSAVSNVITGVHDPSHVPIDTDEDADEEERDSKSSNNNNYSSHNPTHTRSSASPLRAVQALKSLLRSSPRKYEKDKINKNIQVSTTPPRSARVGDFYEVYNNSKSAVLASSSAD